MRLWQWVNGMIRVRVRAVITFRVSRRRREMYIGHARLGVCLGLQSVPKFRFYDNIVPNVCLCLSVPRRIPTLLNRHRCKLGMVGCAL